MLLDRLHEEKDGLKCEMTVSTSRPPTPGLLREGRINLSSATTRTQWQKALSDRPAMIDVDWYSVLEIVCAKAIRRWRQGEPIQDLADVEVRAELPYLLHPIVVEGAATVLFADGASGKSLIALALAVSVATGEEIIPGVIPQRLGPVIFWDWEWDAESHAERLQAICAGAGIEVPKGMIFYQREMVSVIEAIPRMRKRVAETDAVFVIVDSLGYARGGDAISQDLTTRTFGAFRTLERPVLVLDHVSADGKDSNKSFGSIYTRNSARIMWRIDTSKESGHSDWYAALVNTKANRKEQRARGLTIRIETDEDERLLSVKFESTDIREIPGLNKTASLKDNLESIIRANRRAMTVQDLMICLSEEGIGATEGSVRVCLSRHKNLFVNSRDGWGLLATGVNN